MAPAVNCLGDQLGLSFDRGLAGEAKARYIWCVPADVMRATISLEISLRSSLDNTMFSLFVNPSAWSQEGTYDR